MTTDWNNFVLDYRIDRPFKEILSFEQTLGAQGHEAIRTLAQIGFERVRFLGPLVGGKMGNVFVWEPYSGRVGTIEVDLRQYVLFEDTLERFGAEKIAAGLSVLMNLPANDGAVQSLEELETSGANAGWPVAVTLAKLAEAHPGFSFRCEGRQFELPERLSGVQTEFVSEEVVSLADCVVTDASKDSFVQLYCADANASGLPPAFKAFVTGDNFARNQLDLARVLDSRVDMVRVRRVRTLSQAEICAQVESVEVDAGRIHQAVDRRLATAE
jgi:hypothetical protein